MLTGEYLVLKGAKALALPTRLGQGLQVEGNSDGFIHWSSTIKNEPWFEAVFSMPVFDIHSTNNSKVAQRLQQLLLAARQLNPGFLRHSHGENVRSNIEFNAEWGLGSSSTLVSNIAQWAACDAFELNRQVFGGSGYDIACARAEGPLLYQLQGNGPKYRTIAFDPPFKHQLYFVWLNRKQNTRDGIAAINKQAEYTTEVAQLNEVTRQMLTCTDLETFMDLMQKHERIISSVINIEPVQQRMFSDFPGSIKSLGAWGGDFVMAASTGGDKIVKQFFYNRGFFTVFLYPDIILSGL
jgi:mevalonate kinase